MSLKELVVGRKLDISLDAFEAILLVQIHYILNEGDHDSARRHILQKAVLLVRECADLREGVVKLTELGKFAQHADECGYVADFLDNRDGSVLAKGRPCTCGFLELMAELNK